MPLNPPGAPLRARLLGKEDASERVAIVRLQLEQAFHFQAGQYAFLSLVHHRHSVSRPYSIASSPSQTHRLEFCIRIRAQGDLTSSLRHPEVVEALQDPSPSASLTVTGPAGRLVVDPNERRDLVLVASGTGLAPFMSIVRSLNEDYLNATHSFTPRRVYVIHGVSYAADLAYHEELRTLAGETLKNPGRALALIYLPTVSRPAENPDWQGLTGRAETLLEASVHPGHPRTELQEAVRSVLQVTLRPERHLVYACGHAGTVEHVFAALGRRGFRPGTDLIREEPESGRPPIGARGLSR
jgi:ferredoxin--NADP+ reductase